MLRLNLLPVLLLSFTLESGAQVVLRGIVTDSATGEPLVAATVRVAETSRGTITNAKGAYTLPLPPGPYQIVFSYLAYHPETLNVLLDRDRAYNVSLEPSPVQIPEVVVLAEDPALEIIRKAIATKRTWMDQLKSYRFDAFSRQILRRDTAIAGITESYTTGWMKSGDTLREIVKQRRQTENIPSEDNFAAVRRIVNFNDDEIVLFTVRMNNRRSGYRFVGPTAPDALDHYEYKLLKTRLVDGIEMYEIRITPKSRTRPLFDGTIMIADRTFAVVAVDVQPNETFTMPFIRDIELRYRQQFALYEKKYWMPADIRITGGLTVSIAGLSLPRIGIEQVSSIYDYELNIPIPDSILQRRRLSVDSAAVATIDSTFWQMHEVVPLTTNEESAYRTLDSTQTLGKQFRPSGPLGSLGGDGPSGLGFIEHLDAHFNRVEGFYLGANAKLDSLSPYIEMSASFGIGFSDKRVKYEIGTTFHPTTSLSVGASLYRRMDHVPDGGYFGPLAISLAALLDKNDYRDYFLAKGGAIDLTFSPANTFQQRVGFFSEEHLSVESATSFSFFSRNTPYRENPLVREGLMRGVRYALRIGPEAEPFDIVSRTALELAVEHTSPTIAESDFHFTRYNGLFTFSTPTFTQSLLFPPTFRLQVSGGISFGSLPPQRIFTLDSRSSVYAPFGVLRGSRIREFQGDAFAMVNVEHNFRSIPFLLLDLPFLYENSIELVLHGSFAQTWVNDIPYPNGWYSEAGIGLNRIFDVLRADVTYRFRDPRRFFFSVSVANLF